MNKLSETSDDDVITITDTDDDVITIHDSSDEEKDESHVIVISDSNTDEYSTCSSDLEKYDADSVGVRAQDDQEVRLPREGLPVLTPEELRLLEPLPSTDDNDSDDDYFVIEASDRKPNSAKYEGRSQQAVKRIKVTISRTFAIRQYKSDI